MSRLSESICFSLLSNSNTRRARALMPATSSSACFSSTGAFMLEPMKLTRKVKLSMLLMAKPASEGMLGLS